MVAWRSGIASASGTEDPNSNPARFYVSKDIAILLCNIDLICIVFFIEKQRHWPKQDYLYKNGETTTLIIGVYTICIYKSV
jgi:hypothetical protein